jgi:hypothetical protein
MGMLYVDIEPEMVVRVGLGVSSAKPRYYIYRWFFTPAQDGVRLCGFRDKEGDLLTSSPIIGIAGRTVETQNSIYHLCDEDLLANRDGTLYGRLIGSFLQYGGARTCR